MNKKSFIFSLFFLLLNAPVFASIFYVANNGRDANPGTMAQPFLTIQQAQSAVSAGDTVYIRGGTYNMTESQIAQYSGIWAYVTKLDKSGTSGNRIKYWAYPGEKPIFNYSAINPAGYRIHAFQVNGSWLHIKGIEVIGVQVNILTHTQSECFENQGSNNIYEMLSMHDGKAIGFYLTKGGNNLILNCDAYNNWDNVSENKLGGNTDGFGCHPNNDNVGYTNNVFRGCRAWFNSDDGYDCINAFESTTFENCWAFYNGYSTAFASLGDGNGFKAGGYGVSLTPAVPDVIPRNTVRFCLAIRNKSNGFYANHHLGGSNWYNNTAYFNSSNYNMLNRSANYTADVAGYGHNMKNNLGWGGRSVEYNNLDFALCNADTNYFNLPVTVNASDFVSMDQSLLTAPRQADGSLPNNDFMKLVAASDVIDKGLDIGFAFNGTAPDLGFAEYGAALPVELLSFVATINKNAVLLQWKSATEIQNKGWEIERADNGGAWEKIAFVTGKGNSTQPTVYTYSDANIAAGKYQYRLKQLDANGNFKYSNIQSVTFSKNGQVALSVFPMPVLTRASVNYILTANSKVKLSLYNAAGALVSTLVDGNVEAGLHHTELQENLLGAAGSYFLTLSVDDKITTRVFVKAKS